MIEPPLERLNYYNGQRLEAGDLKLEQEYHIRTRRWLNKSLYTTGIASDLDVRAEKGTRTVIVSPGLALDAEGREILLLEEARLTVPGKPHKKAQGSDATVEGLYLTIRYHEESIHEERNGCVPQIEGSKQNGHRPAWGGPARVQTKPQFNWRDSLPYESSGEVLLAQVELTPDCSQVHQVNTGVRRYVGAASDAKVRQYALEGERHIDKDNPGRIYFHIRGRQPKAVALYLRAEKFSTLYYTELGKHHHAISSTGFSVTVPQHSHSITPITTPAGTGTGAAGAHTPSYSDIIGRATEVTNPPSYSFMLTPVGFFAPGIPPYIIPGTVGVRSLRNWADMSINFDSVADHAHSIPASSDTDPAKTIPLSGMGRSSDEGVDNIQARSSSSANQQQALTFVSNLQVLIGPDISRLVNHTNDIVTQLRAAQPTETWDQLGNGGGGHALAVKGTSEIKLDFLPNIAFTEGEYVIELRVNGGGGRILYNLYVE
ncbi:MAG: hypothetical protein JSS26_04670 [Nitrospira sp.]|nr:hypothetical protein [Nitrospira sp.]